MKNFSLTPKKKNEKLRRGEEEKQIPYKDLNFLRFNKDVAAIENYALSDERDSWQARTDTRISAPEHLL